MTANTQQCLSFLVNFVNVGMDAFELFADPGPGAPITTSTLVQQVIYSAVAGPVQVVAPSQKAVCLGANISQFDPIYGPGRTGLTCHLASGSSIAHDGVNAGFAEMYPVGQDCNFVDISNVQPGTYWLEGEVNPADALGNRAYLESDYSNNISRSQVTIGEASCPCPNGAHNMANNCLF